ncbi:MAG: hypothetical protein H0V80_07670 [Acidobacteria bacterium]|nr:hypothetical protein [Acidobacteriota bacterium]
MLQSLSGAAVWLEQTPLAAAVRSSTWAYPATEIVHLIGLGLLIGTAVTFDMRLLGVGARLPVALLAAHLLPWSRLGFALLAVTGVLLFAANASTLLNMVLAIKMASITLAVVNASLFHLGIFKSVDRWDVALPTPGVARLAAVVSLACWTTALVCGRMLAYV